MYVLAKRALRNKDLPFVKIYFEELKRLDSSNKGDEYKELVIKMLEFAFENKDDSFAVELQSEGAKLIQIVKLDSKTLNSIKITDDPLLLASALLTTIESYYQSRYSIISSLLRVFMPGEDWLKSMQTLVSKLLELDQNGTACKEFTDHFGQ